MEKLYGWTGRFLKCNLSSEEMSTVSSMDYAHIFIGGRMLAARLYWDEVSPTTDALDPANCLMIMPGPLTGTPATACSRWVMSAKSPLSFPDQYGFGNGGGFFGAGLKLAGYELGKEAEELALARVTPSGYVNDSYGARVFLITSLFYATEPRNPIVQLHEVNFLLLKWALWYTTAGAMSPITTDDLRRIARRAWGSEEAVDFSTYDGKARAAVIIQNRQHAKESMVACDRYFPILDTDQKEDHLGDPALVPQLFEAVTGRELGENDYLALGERSVNLQRAIMGREGRVGRNQDTLGEFNFTEPVELSEGVFGMFNPDLELPGGGSDIVSRKGKTLDRKAFEGMKDEYYRLKGWEVESGLQTRKTLHELSLDFLCKEMEKAGILGTP